MPWAGFEAKVCRKVSKTLAMGLFQCSQTITIWSSPILPFGSETPYQKKDNPFLQSKPVGRVRVNLLVDRGTKSSTNRELNMGHPTEGLHLDLGQPESANPAVDGLHRKPEHWFGRRRKSWKCPPWMLKSQFCQLQGQWVLLWFWILLDDFGLCVFGPDFGYFFIILVFTM